MCGKLLKSRSAAEVLRHCQRAQARERQGVAMPLLPQQAAGMRRGACQPRRARLEGCALEGYCGLHSIRCCAVEETMVGNIGLGAGVLNFFLHATSRVSSSFVLTRRVVTGWRRRARESVTVRGAHVAPARPRQVGPHSDASAGSLLGHCVFVLAAVGSRRHAKAERDGPGRSPSAAPPPP